MGHGRMTSDALYRYVKEGRACHGRTDFEADLPGGKRGVIMHPIDLITGETLEQAFRQHTARAAKSFFRGLENQMHLSGEVPRLGQIARCAEQDGGMAVMPAGMHLARML